MSPLLSLPSMHIYSQPKSKYSLLTASMNIIALCLFASARTSTCNPGNVCATENMPMSQRLKQSLLSILLRGSSMMLQEQSGADLDLMWWCRTSKWWGNKTWMHTISELQKSESVGILMRVEQWRNANRFLFMALHSAKVHVTTILYLCMLYFFIFCMLHTFSPYPSQYCMPIQLFLLRHSNRHMQYHSYWKALQSSVVAFHKAEKNSNMYSKSSSIRPPASWG